MQEGGLYLFKSLACSNTVYYETLEHTKLFLQLANKYLKDYIYIHEYMLCKDGWVFVGRLKSKARIVEAYDQKRIKNKKTPQTLPVWKIISEQIRLFIGEYVTKYNNSTGREGSLIKRSYERYYFDTVQETKQVIRKIRRRVVGLQQAKKMYRAKKGHYRIPKKLGKGGIFLSSRRKNKRGVDLRNLLDLSVFQRFRKKVLAKVVKRTVKYTYQAHKTPIPDS